MQSTLKNQIIKFESDSYIGVAYDPQAQSPSSLTHSVSDQATIHLVSKNNGALALYNFMPARINDSSDPLSDSPLQAMKATFVKVLAGERVLDKEVEASFVGNIEGISALSMRSDHGIPEDQTDIYLETLLEYMPPLALTKYRKANGKAITQEALDELDEISGMLDRAIFKGQLSDDLNTIYRNAQEQLDAFIERGEREIYALEEESLGDLLFHTGHMVNETDLKEKIFGTLTDTNYEFGWRDIYKETLLNYTDLSAFDPDVQEHRDRIMALAEITIKTEKGKELFGQSFLHACLSQDDLPHPLVMNDSRASASKPNLAQSFLISLTSLDAEEQINKIQFYNQAQWSIGIGNKHTHTGKSLKDHLINSSHTGTSFRNSIKEFYKNENPDLSPQVGKKHAQIVINNLLSSYYHSYGEYKHYNMPRRFLTLQGERLDIHPPNSELAVKFYDKNDQIVFESDSIPLISDEFTTEVIPYIPEGKLIEKFHAKKLEDITRLLNSNPLLREEHKKSISSFLCHERDSQGRKVTLAAATVWINDTLSAPDNDMLTQYRRGYMEDSRHIHHELCAAVTLAKIASGETITLDTDNTPTRSNLRNHLANISIGDVRLTSQDLSPVYNLPAGHANKRHYDKKYAKWSHNVHDASLVLKKEFPPVTTQAWDPSTDRIHIGTIKGENYFAQPLHTYDQFLVEGDEMRHCIGTYAQSGASGDYYAWSIQRESNGNVEKVSTLGMNSDGYSYIELDQHYGYNNSQPDADLRKLVKDFSDSIVDSVQNPSIDNEISFKFTRDSNTEMEPAEKAGLVIGYDTTHPKFIERASELIDSYTKPGFINEVLEVALENSSTLKNIHTKNTIEENTPDEEAMYIDMKR